MCDTEFGQQKFHGRQKDNMRVNELMGLLLHELVSIIGSL